MVWGVFLAKDQSTLSILTVKQHSSTYTEIMQNHLLSFFPQYYKSDFTFQHDNTPVHISFETKQWLAARKIKTRAWPASSLELYPVENI